MKIKVSDYIALFLKQNNIYNVFCVTGGGSMHLNDSFGHDKEIKCTYFHHEQSASMAAEAFSRVNNEIAAVCVTSGPGSTNAITGVVCGWMSSIPMLIFSGQVRYATSIHTCKERLRTRGIQEFDIVSSTKNMTKYSVIVFEPREIAFHLEKALFLAKHGKPGPCWLDIPLDVQNSIIETRQLKHYDNKKEKKSFSTKTAKTIIDKIEKSNRPVLIVGKGIRLSNSYRLFVKLIDLLNVPVVNTTASVDCVPHDSNLYIGMCGIIGTRAGNYAVQNSDLIIALGSRLSYSTTGFDVDNWGSNAYKIANNIDINEISREELKIDIKINCDVQFVISKLINDLNKPLKPKNEWLDQCIKWRIKYQIIQKKYYDDVLPNLYVFYKELSKALNNTDCLVVSAGSARAIGSQSFVIREGMRFITNSSTASMGYDLPAAIGVCIARNKKRTILCTGDGSFQMNIQELQTIVHHNFPIKIFVFNNEGYCSIRITQDNYFQKPYVGIGKDSGDLSFPNLSKLIPAYGLQYFSCKKPNDISNIIELVLSYEGPCVCEIFSSKLQKIEPKVTDKRLKSGRVIKSSLENMSPFLSKRELKENTKNIGTKRK